MNETALFKVESSGLLTKIKTVGVYNDEEIAIFNYFHISHKQFACFFFTRSKVYVVYNLDDDIEKRYTYKGNLSLRDMKVCPYQRNIYFIHYFTSDSIDALAKLKTKKGIIQLKLIRKI